MVDPTNICIKINAILRYIFIILMSIGVADSIFWIRPFIDKSMKSRKPNHNYWPWIPVSHSKERVPKHNFWPWIPVKGPEKDTKYTPPIAPERPKPTFPLPSTIKLLLPEASVTGSYSVSEHPEGIPGREAVLIHCGYNYDEVLDKSILFYEAQRSGRLPRYRRLKWRGDSAVDDKGIFGEDLSGGWYDAGDHMKYGLPMAASATVLIWGFLEYRESYETAGLLSYMMDCVKWPLDYFVKAHTKPYEFYAQVGNTVSDHSFWGRHEDMRMFRPAYRLTPKRPGSDVIGETAAALAAGAIMFNKTDTIYARNLLRHSMELFSFANKYRGKYSDEIPSVKEYYRSTGYMDELVWASLWIYMATLNEWYLKFAERHCKHAEVWAFCWDHKEIGNAVLLYKITRKRKYRDNIIEYMNEWLPGGSVPYTPKGLAYRDEWGALGYAANMAFIALVAADTGIRARSYRDWARSQIHYILGDSGRSYVVGFGRNPPKRPHHATSSCRPKPYPCDWDDFYKEEPNSIVLYGAVVGGPDIHDEFVDDRSDYIHNEVACDYNAGFQSAVAGLKHLYLRNTYIGRNNSQSQRNYNRNNSQFQRNNNRNNRRFTRNNNQDNAQFQGYNNRNNSSSQRNNSRNNNTFPRNNSRTTSPFRRNNNRNNSSSQKNNSRNNNTFQRNNSRTNSPFRRNNNRNYSGSQRNNQNSQFQRNDNRNNSQTQRNNSQTQRNNSQNNSPLQRYNNGNRKFQRNNNRNSSGSQRNNNRNNSPPQRNNNRRNNARRNNISLTPRRSPYSSPYGR